MEVVSKFNPISHSPIYHIFNFISFIHFTVYTIDKSSTNKVKGIKSRANSASEVCHLPPKIVEIGLEVFKTPDTELVELSTYSWFYTESIGKILRYVIEIQRKSFPGNIMSLSPNRLNRDNTGISLIYLIYEF